MCCGHDHNASIQTVQNIKGGHTWYVNPGTVGGVGAPATYVLGDLTTMQFDIFDVPPEESDNSSRLTIAS